MRPLTMAAFAAMLLASTSASGWQKVANGVEYRALEDDHAYAFRLDLQQVELRAATATKSPGAASVKTIAEQIFKTGSLLAINGSFFEPDMTPLGLLVSEGKQLNRLRRADWGVLTISRQGHARITHTRDHKRTKATLFAIQAGPRLVVDGKILSLKPQSARRTAIGITRGNPRQLIVLVTTHSTLLSKLAHLLRDELGCSYALNLDGGSSTQLWSRLKGVPNIDGVPVANAVLVVPR